MGEREFQRDMYVYIYIYRERDMLLLVWLVVVVVVVVLVVVVVVVVNGQMRVSEGIPSLGAKPVIISHDAVGRCVEGFAA